MEPKLFLEIPDDQKFYQWGSSVELLQKLIDFLDREADNISEIYLSMRQYNNSVLHEKMKAFADRGIRVTVISVPPDGYDDRHPRDIYEYGTNKRYRHHVTIRSLAEEIYEDIEKGNSENYILRIFDHTCVRKSTVRYASSSGRKLPYSLHDQSVYIRYKDGRTVTGLTSSGLASGYRPMAELMLLAEDTPESREITELFFSNLLRHSVRLSDWQDPYPDYHCEMESVDGKTVGMNYFTAPFIQDSPDKIEKRIMDIISGAQERIYLCAEDLTAFRYRDTKNKVTRPGIFGAVFGKCRPGIDVRCLSRTYVDANGDPQGQLAPSDSAGFKKLIRQVDQSGSCSYSVNRHVSAKFIVADNRIIVGTGNYTPTEFICGDVLIDRSDAANVSGISYRGTYSKVNHYMILENRGLAEQLIGFFHEILAQPDTYVHGTTDANRTTDAYTEERHYINCPYKEKDEAKKLGAKWDSERKQWYYTDSRNAHLFQKWRQDVSRAKDGFLPFGNKPETESQEVFSDQIGEDEEDIWDVEEGADEWFTDDRNEPDEQTESWEFGYWKIAGDMKKCVELIQYGRSDTEKKDAASSLRRHLERCLDDMNLIDLTAVYKGLHENNVLGYKPSAVAEFVRRMARRYPRPLGTDQK